MILYYRVIHSDYGKNRQMEFKYTKDLFGPYKKDLYWSSTKGGLIKEEQQIDTNHPQVYNYLDNTTTIKIEYFILTLLGMD